METVAYPVNRKRLTLALAVCLLGLILSFGMVYFFYGERRMGPVSSAMLLACGVLCGAAALGFAAQFFNRAGLIIAAEGFSHIAYWRRKHFRWADVSAFRVEILKGTALIAFDHAKSTAGFWANINRDHLGSNEMILAHAFDWPIDQVCGALNHYREQALARGS